MKYCCYGCIPLKKLLSSKSPLGAIQGERPEYYNFDLLIVMFQLLLIEYVA